MTVSIITENFGKYNPANIDEYIKLGGFEVLKSLLSKSNKEITDELYKTGILGRGGAAYEMAKKWEQAKEVPGAPENKVVICNADEGEPCTFKDREILAQDPFRLIEGMALCGHAVGAANGYIYLREEYGFLKPQLQNAIDAAREKGFLGKGIAGSGTDFDIIIYSGAGAYVCGEGSTLLESMEGRSGRPRSKPPYVKQAGFKLLPTCMNNVESFAAAIGAFKYGPAEYGALGTKASPGTKMICLGGNITNPGVYEIPFGLTIREIINDIGGGMKNGKELHFFQLGGASGGIGSAELQDTPYTYKDLEDKGLTVGSGGFLVVDEDTEVKDFLRGIQDFFDHESCGKCTPCREGNRQISQIIDRLVKDELFENDIEIAKRYAETMVETSFCGLGETAQSAFLTALKYFPEVFQARVKERV